MRDKIKKMEQVVQDLVKIEPELMQHLARIRQVAPDSARVIANKLFRDSMVPGVGNKAAYEDFLERPRAGVHVMMDGNDFGQINKKFGQTEGDNAIKAMGGAMRRASRQFRGKLFRVGGDEFKAHFETPEQAYGFVRSVRNELDRLPPAGGQHRHSISIGLGHTPEHAEQAVIHAKNAKKAANYQPGQAKTHAHSLLDNAAGPVPTGPEMPPPGFVHPIK
jgi:GGDEF domain-containing protein